MNETIIMFALVEYIKDFKHHNLDSPLKYEAIDELIRINNKAKIEGRGYFVDLFKQIDFNALDKKNYYQRKGR